MDAKMDMWDTHEYKTHMEILTKHTLIQVGDFDPTQLCQAFEYLSEQCASSRRCQEQLLEVLGIPSTVIDRMVAEYEERLLTAIKQGIKFYISLTTDNGRTSRITWLESKKNFIKWMKFEEDKDVRDLLCALMLNIIRGQQVLAQEVARTDGVLEPIIDASLENSCNAKKFLHDVWYELDTDAVLLRYMFQCRARYRKHTMESYNNFAKKHDPTLKYVEFMKNGLMKAFGKPFKNLTKLEVVELSCLLKIIVTYTSDDKYVKVYQNDLSFLVLIKSLLEAIHMEGKNPDSVFAPNENFFDDQCTVSNLKSSLVRLIANLCWRNEKTQNKIREIEGIPLLLDCSKRDGNNPFITEAVVFALGNICEDNVENQQFIRMVNSECTRTNEQ